MANAPGVKLYVQTESILTREPVGEYLESTMGGSVNFLLARDIETRQFSINGNYSFYTGVTAIDTVWIAEFDCQILNIEFGHKIVGTSGTTTIDILNSTDHGTSWASIFTTLPSITTTAANYSWSGTGQTVTGFTAPVTVGSPTPFSVAQGDGFRMDLISAMGGSAQDLWVKLTILTR